MISKLLLQNSFYRGFVSAVAVCTLAACAGHPPVERSPGLSPAALLDGAAFNFSTADELPPQQLTALNDEMKAFVRENVPQELGAQRKAEILLGALLEDGLQVRYSSFKTYTAQEAFASREGNCLSFTNLYIALAREAGLNARYQEVDVPANWTSRGNTYLYNLHVNTVVKLSSGELVIDFDEGMFSQEYHRRPITDSLVLAQYHNNMSVHWINEDKLKTAFAHIRAALQLYPDVDYFWTTLGTLYRRSGHLLEAEAAYLQAVEIGAEPVALSNLARLYAQLGEPELAAYYRDTVDGFRYKNPYYLFDLAEEAYAVQQYPEAEKLLRRAIRLYSDEHEFHRLLGLTYIQLAEFSKAERQFQRGAKLTSNPEQQARYSQKLQLLAGP